jgi:hypothetical protein
MVVWHHESNVTAISWWEQVVVDKMMMMSDYDDDVGLLWTNMLKVVGVISGRQFKQE